MDDRVERRMGPVPEPLTAPPDATSDHRVELLERGPFLLARCSCGWAAPARRSRPLARNEARTHAAGA
ncbi:hypothetical protein [Streptomyces zhaozhouensis]|nr:hypothetical protein [Streptomyces zhaozhouensis]